MRLLAFAPLATLACVFASPVRAADDVVPVTLEPSSPWNVDFGEDKCRLARTFGREGNRHVLFFEQGWPGSYFGFTVAGPQLERFRSARIAIRLGEYPAIENPQPFRGTNEEFGKALIYQALMLAANDDQGKVQNLRPHALPEIDLAQAAKVSTVSVRQGRREVVFNTGEITDAVTVLNQCSQDLLNSWGLDLERHRTATRLPVFTNAPQVMDRIRGRYPARALSRGEQAIIWMRVIVDETGKVAECTLIKATIAELLKPFACEAMTRARFEPALDHDGKPMRSYAITILPFRIVG